MKTSYEKRALAHPLIALTKVFCAANRFLRFEMFYSAGILACFAALATMSTATSYRQTDQVTRLVSDLRSEDPSTRSRARNELVKMGTPAVDALSAALRDNDPYIRMTAADLLGEMKAPGAVQPLITALKDKDSLVRQNAANALVRIKDPGSVELLIAATKEEDPDFRTTAAKVLGQMKVRGAALDPLIIALKSEDFPVRMKAIEALVEIIDPKEVERLIAVAEKDKADLARQQAAEPARARGEEIPLLIHGNDGSKQARATLVLVADMVFGGNEEEGIWRLDANIINPFSGKVVKTGRSSLTGTSGLKTPDSDEVTLPFLTMYKKSENSARAYFKIGKGNLKIWWSGETKGAASAPDTEIRLSPSWIAASKKLPPSADHPSGGLVISSPSVNGKVLEFFIQFDGRYLKSMGTQP